MQDAPSDGHPERWGNHGAGPLRDPYIVLDVPYNATTAEIRAAYKQKALQYHPDRNAKYDQQRQAQAAVSFNEIGEAYEAIGGGDSAFPVEVAWKDLMKRVTPNTWSEMILQDPMTKLQMSVEFLHTADVKMSEHNWGAALREFQAVVKLLQREVIDRDNLPPIVWQQISEVVGCCYTRSAGCLIGLTKAECAKHMDFRQTDAPGLFEQIAESVSNALLYSESVKLELLLHQAEAALLQQQLELAATMLQRCRGAMRTEVKRRMMQGVPPSTSNPLLPHLEQLEMDLQTRVRWGAQPPRPDSAPLHFVRSIPASENPTQHLAAVAMPIPAPLLQLTQSPAVEAGSSCGYYRATEHGFVSVAAELTLLAVPQAPKSRFQMRKAQHDNEVRMRQHKVTALQKSVQKDQELIAKQAQEQLMVIESQELLATHNYLFQEAERQRKQTAVELAAMPLAERSLAISKVS